ncbi:MAG: hypothetical protein GY869_23130 [Planctomycetes bacterium]|nr:hypothetical protein [Planctomycetota bacterium]
MSAEQNPITSKNGKDNGVMKSAKIRTTTSSLDKHKHEFTRPTNVNGTGATRIRTFHVRLSESAMQFLDDHINEWMDQNPDVEVKFICTTIGAFEGKRGTEQNLIMNVWY